MFEHANRLIARDGRKIFEKLVERNAGFEIIKECRNWHARSGEHGRAAHNIAVNCNGNIFGDRRHTAHFSIRKAPVDRSLFYAMNRAL